MVSVFPKEERHCALPVPWTMDASPWVRVSISRHYKKLLQTKGPLSVTRVVVSVPL